MTPDPTTVETIQLVELSELLALARLGYDMRRAQKRFFEQRKRQPHAPGAAELIAARAAESRFDRAVALALARERVGLPGMEGGAVV